MDGDNNRSGAFLGTAASDDPGRRVGEGDAGADSSCSAGATGAAYGNRDGSASRMRVLATTTGGSDLDVGKADDGVDIRRTWKVAGLVRRGHKTTE